MAKRKESELVEQGAQDLTPQGQAGQTALTPEQAQSMASGQTSELINLLQSSQGAQLTNLLVSILQSTTQQNAAGADALTISAELRPHFAEWCFVEC